MSDSVIYVPKEIKTVKNGKTANYEMLKQSFVGNSYEAKKVAKELKKQYPVPKFIIRRNSVIVTVYEFYSSL